MADWTQATLMRNYRTPNERAPKEQSYKFARGTTAFLKEVKVEREDIRRYVTIRDVPATGDAMEVDV